MVLDLKKVFLVGTLGFILISLGLFYILTSSVSYDSPEESDNKLEYIQLESKLKELENAMTGHRKSLDSLKALVDERSKGIPAELSVSEKKLSAVADKLTSGHKMERTNAKQCSAAVDVGLQPKSDVNMLDIYELIKFDNVDGGAWKQGWNIEVDMNRFSSQNKLRVFVIPHSHNDPGWIKTFEKYFQDQTKRILDLMLDKLLENPELKFIWAEISYFNLWWETLDVASKANVKRLVDDGQLEFVTGGWVMPDEANAHYFSILSQLLEGHQWLYHHLNYTPRNGWSIDPFGMSPTNAYILKRAGLKNMLIQRTHYEVKKQLARSRELEFMWRQNWDNEGSSDILCHMMPFYSYDIPHTCGPDPKVCCQFDFKRMSKLSSIGCPWGVLPQPIVAQDKVRRQNKALLLLDQYRKKSMLYRTNVLLIPLGDDFRWDDAGEWKAQTDNYLALMDTINSQPDLNAEVKFGTLSDYFEALAEEITDHTFTPSALTGDFFTYADREDHYWSGYFTSRPFHKAADRQLIGHLRTAHIAFTLMSGELIKRSSSTDEVLKLPFLRSLLGNLIQSRRALSLFQHHDGITGTSKDHVMIDYGKKLLSALNSANIVSQQALQILLTLDNGNDAISEVTPDAVFFDAAIARDAASTLPQYNLIILDKEMNQRLVVVFNSVPRRRNQLVRLFVSTYNIKVYDRNGKPVDSDVLPVFEDKTRIRTNIFELNFVAEIGPLSIQSFILKLESGNFVAPQLSVLNPFEDIQQNDKLPIRILEGDQEIGISNDHFSVRFDKNGFVNSVTIDGTTRPFRISMNQYGARHTRETSGLYLFLPDGPAKKVDVGKPFVRIVKGKFQEYVEVWLSQVKHKLTVYKHSGFDKYSIEIKNVVDIRHERNFELMMKMETDIASGDIFYTDLNAFQMIKRKRLAKIPLQGNYYPLPSSGYIEDPSLRFTILSGQPLGGSSLESGEFEIIMDRRLMQDDNRGAGQGATDNLETENTFKLMFEIPQCQDPNRNITPPMLSLQAQIQQEDLLHPLVTFIGQPDLSTDSLTKMSDYIPKGNRALPCDIELTDAAPLPSYKDPLDDNTFTPTPSVGIWVRRVGYDGQFLDSLPLPQCLSERSLGEFTPKDLFGDFMPLQVEQRTLTFTHPGKPLPSNEPVLMKPMEIYGFLADFHSDRVD